MTGAFRRMQRHIRSRSKSECILLWMFQRHWSLISMDALESCLNSSFSYLRPSLESFLFRLIWLCCRPALSLGLAFISGSRGLISEKANHRQDETNKPKNWKTQTENRRSFEPLWDTRSPCGVPRRNHRKIKRTRPTPHLTTLQRFLAKLFLFISWLICHFISNLISEGSYTGWGIWSTGGSDVSSETRGFFYFHRKTSLSNYYRI